MGVPKFYRWISERYPQINQMLSGTTILPEFDNFYLDMNGIIHACTHPNDNSTANSLTMREMMLAIFRYIDHMVTEIVKPKKILFMAIDGVAPRAKLNQQRARRFRAAQERQESIAKARQKGETIDEENLFDSNCITPGTEFMEHVGKHLRYFIRKKIKEDPLWRDLRIVFSGHDVPGEGEHKIMQFIRDLRADPRYEPNQRHCMYGQDADLIMLGLATHEPHFALLREVVNFNFNRGGGSTRQTVLRQTKNAQFQLLHLSILREYLSLDFAYECAWLPDQERLFDDFILLTFLVGNDFLPHLPTLDISEHAFDVLISAYRQLMAEEPGYIVHNGEIGDLVRLEKLFAIVGEQEQSILKAREDDVRAFNKKRSKFKDAVNVMTEEELEEAEERLQLAFETALNIAMGKDSNSSEGGDEDENEPEWDLDEHDNVVQRPAWVEVNKATLPTKVEGRKGKGKFAQNINDKHENEGAEDVDVVSKDYRGRYYYEKFKIVAGTDKGQQFLSGLMSHYLKGLMWCLAYYIKGCVSWTWYYPFHYGPMLKDMTGLTAISEQICFELGEPFKPFQQLLGCLPPASCTLLPRTYQWLMLSADSPVLHFYPIDFGIDQDGKKNPWEAVVLLDFIDERLLMDAETKHCPPIKLTKVENARNQFGSVLTHLFDPSAVDMYPSCNPEIQLPDIPCCQSTVSESYPSLSPGCFFKPELVPGTVYPIAGFPSLTILPLNGMKTEAVKINMFGSESKYKSLVLEIRSPDVVAMDASKAEPLLGRIVYVNYPQIHEAKVVAVTTSKEEVRLVNGLPQHTLWDSIASRQWAQESEDEEGKYLKGRGTPGTGGLRIGNVVVRLRVAPLQGLQRDPNTGASKKVFSASEEADVPIQMALWTPPVVDTRFEETAELSLEELMPHNAEVVALTGDLVGYKGRIIGPHGPTAEEPTVTPANKRGSLKQDMKKEQGFHNTTTGQAKKRTVDIEFTITPPEPPFGYSIANSVKEEFYSSKDLCALLQISASVLGKVVGMIRVEPGRADLGLNLKRNGQYQLLGYSQRVDYAVGGGDPAAAQHTQRKVWGGVDTVEIVGMVSNDAATVDRAAEVDSAGWQYTARTAALIFDYKTNFPQLFSQLERLPHQPVYSPDALLGPGGDKMLEAVQEWMKAQPFFKLPRTPFTTLSMSKDAMAAVERAADVQTAKRKASSEQAVVMVKGVPVENVFCAAHRTVGDVALAFNQLEPRLGDRVVNLTCPGVPFGLKGTVVTIHSNTKFVELIFDEEFIGGKGLQGSCSQFRGRLAPWTDLLLVSRSNEFLEFSKGKGSKIAAKSASHNVTAAIAPQQVKHIAQRGSSTSSTPSAHKTTSYAKATAPSVHSQKPVVSQSTTSAGHKLLKALQKGDIKTGSTSEVSSSAAAGNRLTPASKVSILKKKIGIVDQPAVTSSSVPLSNGTGMNILAEAAGFSNEEINKVDALLPSFAVLQQHAMMAGVISYQAQQATALHKSSLTSAPMLPNPATVITENQSDVYPPPPPPTQSTRHDAHAGHAKLALNKDATRRIIAHELKPNSNTTSHTMHGKTVVPRSKANTTATAIASTHSEPHASSRPIPHSTKLHAKELSTIPAAGRISAPHDAVTSTAVPIHAPIKTMTMAEKLANAKKVMKEKQLQMMHNITTSFSDGGHGHAHNFSSQSTNKKAGGHKEEKKAPNILSILTKAKSAMESSAVASTASVETSQPVSRVMTVSNPTHGDNTHDIVSKLVRAKSTIQVTANLANVEVPDSPVNHSTIDPPVVQTRRQSGVHSVPKTPHHIVPKLMTAKSTIDVTAALAKAGAEGHLVDTAIIVDPAPAPPAPSSSIANILLNAKRVSASSATSSSSDFVVPTASPPVSASKKKAALVPSKVIITKSK